MAQNHSPTWDWKFGNLCQMIWKTFQDSMPSKKPLKNGSDMLAHVSFVEPTSIRLVLFNLWMQNQLFLHGFYLSSSIYLSIHGSRTIVPEENCSPTLILTLTLNQTLTLTEGQFSSGAIVQTPYIYIYIYIYIYVYISALKITAGQRSLTVITAFVTVENHHSMITMTTNT